MARLNCTFKQGKSVRLNGKRNMYSVRLNGKAKVNIK